MTQFQRVLQVLIPSFIFAIAIDYIGIYVAGGLFIAFFMWWLGKYPLPKVVLVSVLVPLALFVVFEMWFLVPLPKGPVEAYLRLLIASRGRPSRHASDRSRRPSARSPKSPAAIAGASARRAWLSAP